MNAGKSVVAASALGALLLAACGNVEVATDLEFPKPLIDELPMTVGVYYSEEFRKYAHAEERWGVDWKVELGQFHVRLGGRLLDAAFRDVVEVSNLESIPTSPPLRAVIEPRIEQFSFITPRDTGAKYYAVTIRYRLNVFAPDGRLADSLTFTGYGSSPSGGITSTTPMILATKAAMRDAAAKFLVQFPEQAITKKMIAELPLIEEPVAPAVAGSASAPGDKIVIESVPIVDSAPQATAPASPPPPPASSPPAEPETPGSSAPPATEPEGSPPEESPPEAKPESKPPQAQPDPQREEDPVRWTGAGLPNSSTR